MTHETIIYDTDAETLLTCVSSGDPSVGIYGAFIHIILPFSNRFLRDDEGVWAQEIKENFRQLCADVLDFPTSAQYDWETAEELQRELEAEQARDEVERQEMELMRDERADGGLEEDGDGPTIYQPEDFKS